MERMFSRADLRKLLVPLMVEQALAMTIGMADTVMVASCSEAAVSHFSKGIFAARQATVRAC